MCRDVTVSFRRLTSVYVVEIYFCSLAFVCEGLDSARERMCTSEKTPERERMLEGSTGDRLSYISDVDASTSLKK